EAAEYNPAVCARWQCGNGRRERWRSVAEIAPRQPYDAFDVQIVLFLRTDHSVGDQVVDGFDPGCIEITHPGRLDRGRLAREHEEPVVSQVTGQVHKNVDTIRPNDVGCLCVAEVDQAAPPIR